MCPGHYSLLFPASLLFLQALPEVMTRQHQVAVMLLGAVTDYSENLPIAKLQQGYLAVAGCMGAPFLLVTFSLINSSCLVLQPACTTSWTVFTACCAFV